MKHGIPLSEFARIVQAVEGAGEPVQGLEIEPRVNLGSLVADLSHLVEPFRLNQGGLTLAAGPVVAQFSAVEFVCTRPAWFTHLSPLDSGGFAIRLAVRDVRVTAGALVSGSVWSGSMVNQAAPGTNAAAQLGVNVFSWSQSTPERQLGEDRGIFVPKGKILVLESAIVNTTLTVRAAWIEVPLP